MSDPHGGTVHELPSRPVNVPARLSAGFGVIGFFGWGISFWLVLCYLGPFALMLMSIWYGTGFALGISGMRRSRHAHYYGEGHGWALTGLVVNGIGCALVLVVLVLLTMAFLA